MADYYPLLARAVSALEVSTGDSRRALYERARTALHAQLQGSGQTLSEADTARELQALEDAIRQVEAETVRRPYAARDEGAAAVREALHGAAEDAGPGVSQPLPQAPSAEDIAAGLRGAEESTPRERPSFGRDSTKGFREKTAKDQRREMAADRKGKPAEELFDAFPPLGADASRNEPGFDSEDLLKGPRDLPAATASESRGGSPRPRAGGASARPSHPDNLEEIRRKRPLGTGIRGLSRTVVIAAVAVIVLAVGGALAYWQWPRIAALHTPGAVPSQVAQNGAQPSGKIADRIGAGSPPASSSAPSRPAADVAQRAVLYEKLPNAQENKQYLGSVIWRTEKTSPGPGLQADIAIKADVDIPERQMRMSFTLQRNQDKSLPVSHTIQVLFSTPPDFPHRGVADAPGVLMEDNDGRTRPAPLSGLRVPVAEGFFLIGLSPVESEARRNVLLLKDGSWLQIPIVYKDGQHALLTLEKGVPGDRAFTEAFAAWQQGASDGQQPQQ